MERGPSAHEVTILPQAWRSGSNEAFDRLTPLVYRELRQITGCLIADQRPNHTLQATPLVNEAYVRLVHPRKASWQVRVHSFVLCAPAMPQILIDHARASEKRGGGQLLFDLDEALLAAPSPTANLLEIDDALKRLAQLDPRTSQVVEQRFFGGLNLEEASKALNVSTKTMQSGWDVARAWLYGELRGKHQDE